ncbi:MAG: ATP-binding cassette domain-containing protein [Propioniciclava sp.]
MTAISPAPVLSATGLNKRFGHVVGLDDVSVEVNSGEVLAIIGDNGAGKSTLIKCLTGALIPDSGDIFVEGQRVDLRRPQDAQEYGIETVYQTLAVVPALNIARNMYLGREQRVPGLVGKLFRTLDTKGMRDRAKERVDALGIQTIQDMDVAVENLSGGQRQAVAVARAAAFGSRVIVLDEPTAALGVRESAQVLDLIKGLRERGLGVVLISHNMPHVWELADRIQVQRLGRRIHVITPDSHSMTDGVAMMTGALE